MASELRRRDVLRASGALALAGAAGCLDDVIGETSEGNDSDGEGGNGDDPTPADGNDTETAEGTDDPDDEGGSNGTDGPGESNDSEGSDDGDPGGANESNGTDGSDETNDSNGTDDSVGDGENDSGQGDDGDDETREPNETEDSDGGDGEGDGADAEETKTEADGSGGDEANDSAEDDGTGEGGDGDEETGEGNGEGDDGGDDGDDGESQSTNPPEGFVTYANDELGYSIAHPERWEVEESGEEVYVGDPESRRELGVLTLDAAAFDSSEALSAEFIANLEADYEGVEVGGEGERSLVSGQDARLLDVAYGNPDGERGRRRSRLLFVTDPGTDAGYVAEVAAPAGAFDDAFVERADTMLESFRID